MKSATGFIYVLGLSFAIAVADEPPGTVKLYAQVELTGYFDGQNSAVYLISPQQRKEQEEKLSKPISDPTNYFAKRSRELARKRWKQRLSNSRWALKLSNVKISSDTSKELNGCRELVKGKTQLIPQTDSRTGKQHLRSNRVVIVSSLELVKAQQKE